MSPAKREKSVKKKDAFPDPQQKFSESSPSPQPNRPLSNRSKSPRTPDSLKSQPLGVAQDDFEKLKKDYDELYDTYAKLDTNYNALQTKYDKAMNHLVNTLQQLNLDFDPEPLKSSEEPIFLELVTKVCQVALHPPPTEVRMEEMETRITFQNRELNELRHMCSSYEKVLSWIGQCKNLEEIHNRISDVFVETGKVMRDITQINERQLNKSLNSGCKIIRPQSASTFSCLESRQSQIHLIPPENKLPGNTHINQMNTDLKSYLCNELNRQRKCGSDWRLLGERVGIDRQSIVAWQQLNLVSPTARVFAMWAKSSNATVRMLHRHLSAPEMNACRLLIRRIEQFYTVET